MHVPGGSPTLVLVPDAGAALRQFVFYRERCCPMSDLKLAFETLPHWPLWLNQRQAAAYLGISTGTFRSEIKRGVWPDGSVSDRRFRLWDRRLLEAASNRLSGFSTGTPDEENSPGRDPGYIKRMIEAAYADE